MFNNYILFYFIKHRSCSVVSSVHVSIRRHIPGGASRSVDEPSGMLPPRGRLPPLFLFRFWYMRAIWRARSGSVGLNRRRISWSESVWATPISSMSFPRGSRWGLTKKSDGDMLSMMGCDDGRRMPMRCMAHPDMRNSSSMRASSSWRLLAAVNGGLSFV